MMIIWSLDIDPYYILLRSFICIMPPSINMQHILRVCGCRDRWSRTMIFCLKKKTSVCITWPDSTRASWVCFNECRNKIKDKYIVRSLIQIHCSEIFLFILQISALNKNLVQNPLWLSPAHQCTGTMYSLPVACRNAQF